MLARRVLRVLLSLLVGLITLAAIGAALNPVARAATTTVRLYPDVAPCNTTLQACIDASSDGDVIQIKPGTYLTSVTLDKPVSLIGLGVISPTHLMAASGQRALTVTGAAITASTVISNLRITDGALSGTICPASCGGAVLLAGSARPSLDRLLIDNNSAYQGGGLWVDAGPEVVIVNSGIISNFAQHAGGGIYSESDVRLISAQIERNQSSDNGGGLEVAGALDMHGGKVLSNTAANGGGGARVAMTATLDSGYWEGNTTNGYGGGLFASNLIMTGTQFINNQGYGSGGGAYLNGPGQLSGGRFERNRAIGFRGGGLYANSLRVNGTQFIGNTTAGTGATGGGGAYVSGPADLNLVRFEDNSTMTSGGGLEVGGPMTLTRAAFWNNRADTGNGGGAYAYGPAKVTDTVFVSNSASMRGGGLMAWQGAEVQRSQFLRNTGLQSGGGLDVEGALGVTNSIFISNTSILGGGVFHTLGGGGRVVNSLFARNTASVTGGVLHFGALTGTVDVIHVTIADPGAAGFNLAPAICVESNNVNITNTLIADHAVGISNFLGAVQEDYNLFYNVGALIDGSVLTGGHSLNPAAPQFIDPLSDNYHLRFGAEAIDAGTPAGVAFDIDNQPRPIGPGFDIGFDEAFSSIQQAIDLALPGGMVNLPPGVYTESLTLDKPVNLIGAGANQTIINAAAADRVLTVTGAAITPTTVISGLTFSDGHPAAMGGGILITGLAAPTLIGVNVRDNRAVMGGGLYIDTGGATLIDSQVISNTAEQSGGGAYVAQPGAFLEVSHSSIISNTALDGAGVFVQDGQFRAANFSYLIGNQASHWGGGVLIGGAGGQARIDASRLAFNTATDAGGGVLVDTGRFELIGGTIFSNTSISGGGVYLSQPTAVFTQAGGTVDDNAAQFGGGYYLDDGHITLRGGAVSNNRALNGAGVYVNAGETRLQDTALITGNIARDFGGGVYLSSPRAVLTQLGGSIQSNTAYNGGGVKITDGEYTLRAGDVFQNAATGGSGGGVLLYDAGARFAQYGGSVTGNTAGWGGGLFVQAGRATLIGGRIISNTADLGGGGVAVDAAGQLYMVGQQSRIAGNEARGGDGGGVYVQPGGQAVFVGGRIESNTAQGFGGGLYAQSGLTISGTRFLDNAARDGYAIYHTGGEAGYVVNALVADNYGPAANWNGASVSLNSTGRTQLMFSTLANSVSLSDRAIDVNGGGLSLVNSIVASYTVGISRTAGPVSEDYNLFFGNTISLTEAITPGVHTRSGVDPKLVDPLRDDYHILRDSPAINRALDVGVRRDIDFDARPIGGGFDIGADEFQMGGATIPPGMPPGGITTTMVLSYTAPNGGGAMVFIPPGAVNGPPNNTVAFYYTMIDTDSITTPLPARLKLSGDPFELDAFVGDEFTATQIITFNAPVTITVHYTETELSGINEQTLKLYRLEYPPFGSGWYAIGECRPNESQTLDTVNNIITATVTGFSRWGTMGAQLGVDIFLPVLFKGN